jgi:hypothetical protein
MNIFLSQLSFPISGTDLKDETVVPNGTWDQKGTLKEYIIVDTRFMMVHQGFLELQADLVQIGDTRFMTINQGFQSYKLILSRWEIQGL